MKTVIQTEKAPPAIGPYSQAVQSGNLLFISGQLGLDFTGNLIAEDVAAQTRQVLENIKLIIEAAGFKMDDIVKTTVYLKDLNDFTIVNNIYGEYFQPPYPARACFQVAKLPKDGKVEIEAVASIAKE